MTNPICSHLEDLSSSDDSFCLQVKIQCTSSDCKKIPTPPHLITSLAYSLKPHETRNQYLRVRLDTCTNVNIMPASVYKLVFKDPDLKKLAPSTLEIGTNNTDTVKIAGSCVFYLVQPDTKKLHEITYFLLHMMEVSCTTMLVLGLIQLYTRLDYLSPRASLITSSSKHPKKTKSRVSIHSSRKMWLLKAQNQNLQCLINNK